MVRTRLTDAVEIDLGRPALDAAEAPREAAEAPERDELALALARLADHGNPNVD
jgi:hypothetical protein